MIGKSDRRRHVFVACYERRHSHSLDDPAAVASGLAVPVPYIAADELQPSSDMACFHKLCLRLLYGKTVGSGHFCRLEVPEQVNAMTERSLTTSLSIYKPTRTTFPRPAGRGHTRSVLRAGDSGLESL